MISVQLCNVSVGERSRLALQNVSLQAKTGEICAVIGENGAGKSTLLDTLSGLCPPQGGRVLLDERDLYSMSSMERATRVSSLGQYATLWMEQNVMAYIGQGLVARRGANKLLDASCRAAIERIADEFDVRHLLARSTAQVSGGELRRIQIARTLLDDDVQILVLNEPLAGVDIKHQSAICHALQRRATEGRIVWFSVHDLGIAFDTASRVVALKDGEVVADGSPSEALSPATIEHTFGVRGTIERGQLGTQSVVRMERPASYDGEAKISRG